MGHLLMAGSVGNFKKGVVSFWFRLPAETVAAVRGTNTHSFTPRVFGLGEIPLLTWGEQIQNLPPSHIAVRVGGADYDWGTESLLVHLQTPDIATGGGEGWFARPYPEFFGNSSADSSRPADGYPTVLVDHWNHVMLSWDLGSASVSGGSISGRSKMWCAINDLNKTGDQLPAMGQSWPGMGGNDHLSNHVSEFVTNEAVSASVSVTDIPSNPFAVPSRTVSYTTSDSGSTSEKQPVKRVEMAELQVYAGVTLDTGVEANRRAFVNADGLPVSPQAVDGDGNPIGSEGALGKRAEILLLGSSNWVDGHNSGSAGQFTPTGNIQPWSPDPSLYGPQDPAPPSGVRLTRIPAAVS